MRIAAFLKDHVTECRVCAMLVRIILSRIYQSGTAAFFHRIHKNVITTLDLY